MAAVPVGAMTGVGVDSRNCAIGAGGATVTSITFPFVPTSVPFVATTPTSTLPWMTGTVHVKWTRPPASVVPVCVTSVDP